MEKQSAIGVLRSEKLIANAITSLLKAFIGCANEDIETRNSVAVVFSNATRSRRTDYAQDLHAAVNG